MTLTVDTGRRQRRVRAAEVTGEIPAFLPGSRLEGVNLHILNRKIARLEIDKQRRLGVQRAKQRCFADAGRANDERLDALVLRHPLVSGNDLKPTLHGYLL